MNDVLLTFAVIGLSFVDQVVGKVGMNCNETSQCDPGECCQKLSKYMVASKRDVHQDMPKWPGACSTYTRQGKDCNPLSLPNGYCGCEPGTACTAHKLKDRRGRNTRDLLPGVVMKCNPIGRPTLQVSTPLSEFQDKPEEIIF